MARAESYSEYRKLMLLIILLSSSPRTGSPYLDLDMVMQNFLLPKKYRLFEVTTRNCYVGVSCESYPNLLYLFNQVGWAVPLPSVVEQLQSSLGEILAIKKGNRSRPGDVWPDSDFDQVGSGIYDGYGSQVGPSEGDEMFYRQFVLEDMSRGDRQDGNGHNGNGHKADRPEGLEQGVGDVGSDIYGGSGEDDQRSPFEIEDELKQGGQPVNPEEHHVRIEQYDDL
jgi:hypothetical protein